MAASGGDEVGQVVALAKVIEVHRNNLELTEVAMIFYFLWPVYADKRNRSLQIIQERCTKYWCTALIS